MLSLHLGCAAPPRLSQRDKEITYRMIGVIGSGSWATAIVKILLENKGRRVNWWVRRAEICDSLQHNGRNPHHLKEVILDKERLHVSTDLAAIVAASDMLVVAVPSVYVASVLTQLNPEAYRGKRLVSVVKGFVTEEQTSISQYIEQRLQLPADNICVVSGPSHAEEVAAGQPTFLTIASSNPRLADEMSEALRCSYIHTWVSDDVRGLELCGLTKNVYAVAAGMAAGIGYGDNLIAVLTAAAADELKALVDGTSMSRCLFSDLMVTCFSRHSRNRRLGEAVAHGTTPADHFATTDMVAEGYYSADILHAMAKPSSTPIADAVYRVLYCGTNPKEELDMLIQTVL